MTNLQLFTIIVMALIALVPIILPIFLSKKNQTIRVSIYKLQPWFSYIILFQLWLYILFLAGVLSLFIFLSIFLLFTIFCTLIIIDAFLPINAKEVKIQELRIERGYRTHILRIKTNKGKFSTSEVYPEYQTLSKTLQKAVEINKEVTIQHSRIFKRVFSSTISGEQTKKTEAKLFLFVKKSILLTVGMTLLITLLIVPIGMDLSHLGIYLTVLFICFIIPIWILTFVDYSRRRDLIN